MNWFKFSSPATFYPLAGRLIPYFAALAVVLTLIGLYLGFFVAPTDYKQGEGYRIIFIHVPAARKSIIIYEVMAIYAGAGLVFFSRLSSMMASALAPTGALFTFLALWTGSLWGKPMWGTWCVWDARLTSELILLFLYIGFLSLKASIDDTRRAARASGRRAGGGGSGVPIIYKSGEWWNTLLQGATITVRSGTSMESTMIMALIVMIFAF